MLVAKFDFQVKLKKEYNTRWASGLGLCNGNVWYSQQAFRALNQAIGRCIRHKNDFGAILLLDSRYVRDADRLNGISKWLRPNLEKHHHFTPMTESVKRFFAQNNTPVTTASTLETQIVTKPKGDHKETERLLQPRLVQQTLQFGKTGSPEAVKAPKASVPGCACSLIFCL